MTNAVKGEVPLKLSDGREFVLLSGFGAMVEAEGLYGKPASQIAADAQAGFVGAIRALFFGMLKGRHPNITVAEATDLLTDHMPEIEAAMSAAAKAGQAAEGKQGENPPAGRRGKTSGRSGAKQG